LRRYNHAARVPCVVATHGSALPRTLSLPDQSLRSEPMAQLIERSERGQVVHDLLFQSTSIGRGRLDDIVVNEAGVPRSAARVVALGKDYCLLCRRGRHGSVRVNGDAVSGRRELVDGDRLAVGPRVFEFVMGAAEAAPAAGTRLGGGVVRLTVGTLASRVLGFVREMVVMSYFGASGVLDAFVAASTLPNLFRDVLGEYAAESALTPVYKTLLAHGRGAAARRLLGLVMRAVAVLGTLLVVLGIVLAPWLVVALVPGFTAKHPELVGQAADLARWMMPFLVIIAAAAVFGSVLLAERRFLRYALAPAGLSIGVIAAVALFKGRLGAKSLAVGFVAGGLLQMLLCALPYASRRRRGVPADSEAEGQARGALRKVGRSAMPVALAGVLSKVNVVVDRVLASWFCGLGRISALYGAARLLQLPFAILGLAVGRAALPLLVEEARSDDAQAFPAAVVRALRLSVFLMLPATLGLLLLARPFVRLMFERGAFTAEHTGWAAVALVFYSIGLVGMGARSVLSRAFYVLLDTRTPVAVSSATVACNVVLSVLLVTTPLGHGGLALATAAASWLQGTLLLALLSRLLARQGRHIRLRPLWAGLCRMLVCGAAMGGCTWALVWAMGDPGAGGGLWGRIAAVVAPGGAGLAAYFAAAALLRCEELRELWRLGHRHTHGQSPGSATGG